MSILSSAEAKTCYEKALRLGKKEGGSPLVLDRILKEKGISASVGIPLGVIQIPMEQIVGTKTEGRTNCFSSGFYPLLDVNSEFGMKWVSLCASQMEEGIRDPIKAYEFMNQYYVLEGNKRVSVMHYFDAITITADVIRIMPPQYDDPKIRLYYEYIDFYNLSGVNYVYFTKSGSFSRLQRLLGKSRNEEWNSDDKTNFSSVFYRFKDEYYKILKPASYITISDAFLYFISLYNYSDLIELSTKEFHDLVLKSKDELDIQKNDTDLKLQMDPVNSKTNLLKSLVPKTGPLKIAFIHDKNPDLSGWTYSHDMGRTHIEEIFGNAIKTSVYYNTNSDSIEAILEDAITAGNTLIFTTSPVLLKESLKAAIAHPEVKILNCSLSTAHKNLRTYYSRMYEVKFLMGAIAGAMASNDVVGCIADYPIYGTIAGINAFALGAKMINPRVKVHLLWSKTMESIDIDRYFKEHDIRIICDKDSLTKGQHDQRFGLYMMCEDHTIWNMAMCVWNWSAFYEKIVNNVLHGSMKSEEGKDNSRSINYWWGMSSDVLNLIYSGRLPIGTIRLVEFLKTSICNGSFHPYAGALYSQDGTLKNTADSTLNNDEIITMDWLVDNIVGSIPAASLLTEEAKEVTKVQGIDAQERLL